MLTPPPPQMCLNSTGAAAENGTFGTNVAAQHSVLSQARITGGVFAGVKPVLVQARVTRPLLLPSAHPPQLPNGYTGPRQTHDLPPAAPPAASAAGGAPGGVPKPGPGGPRFFLFG